MAKYEVLEARVHPELGDLKPGDEIDLPAGNKESWLKPKGKPETTAKTEGESK